MNKEFFENISAFHPGYYIKDLIEEMEMTQEEFAKRLDISPKNLSEIVNGKAPLSNNIAVKLSMMLDTSIDVWINLQNEYDKQIAELRYKKNINTVYLLDYKFFLKLGVVKQVRTAEEKNKELCKYFKVGDLSALKNDKFFVSFRQVAVEEKNEKRIINENAWVQTAINFAENIETQKFDEKKLKQILPDIRNMTLQEPHIFFPVLKKKLADCGVALVLLPSLKNSGVYGAVKWLSPYKVLLGMTDRGKNSDTFWFSLFHEIGHILQKNTKKLIVNTKETDQLDDILEQKANQFATNYLIPEDEYEEFICKNNINCSSVLKFAKRLKISPGIIVGRLQKDGYIQYNQLNQLKTKYTVIIEDN